MWIKQQKWTQIGVNTLFDVNNTPMGRMFCNFLQRSGRESNAWLLITETPLKRAVGRCWAAGGLGRLGKWGESLAPVRYQNSRNWLLLPGREVSAVVRYCLMKHWHFSTQMLPCQHGCVVCHHPHPLILERRMNFFMVPMKGHWPEVWVSAVSLTGIWLVTFILLRAQLRKV